MTADLTSLGDWASLPFFSETWPTLSSQIAADNREILPPEQARFAALAHTPPSEVRVIILGQDPYPTPGHANGLAFSVAPDVALPRSLANIYREMRDDIGAAPDNGDLTHWADQGVLLLNTCLSVPAREAAGHARLGWHKLAEQILQRVSKRPCAFLLWGKTAQAFRPHIVGRGHLIVETAHPSPLSAQRGFFGSRPFSAINNWLISRGEPPIRWADRPDSSQGSSDAVLQ